MNTLAVHAIMDLCFGGHYAPRYGSGAATDCPHEGCDPHQRIHPCVRHPDRLQNPRTGGRSSDWKFWLSTIQAIKQIYVYPKRGGTGVVDVVITAGGGRVPSAQTLADASKAGLGKVGFVSDPEMP